MRLRYISILLLIISMISCDALERDIVIDLPEPERILTVECYLEAGQPYRLLLTETKGFFEELDACPLVKGATVIIRHNGITDTLTEANYFSNNCPPDSLFGIIPFFNADFTRFYNYGSSRICPLDYDNDFELEVIDTENDRQVIATTRFLRPVPVDTIDPSWNDNNLASVIISAFDDENEVNFYRVMLHEGSLTEPNGFFNVAKDPEFAISIDDARFFNGGKIAFGTDFNYKEGDTLIASFYHITKAYHDFLETLADSEGANGNPFAVPTQIVSNIQGGQGIFTTLSYDRDTVILVK